MNQDHFAMMSDLFSQDLGEIDISDADASASEKKSTKKDKNGDSKLNGTEDAEPQLKETADFE